MFRKNFLLEIVNKIIKIIGFFKVFFIFYVVCKMYYDFRVGCCYDVIFLLCYKLLINSLRDYCG